MGYCKGCQYYLVYMRCPLQTNQIWQELAALLHTKNAFLDFISANLLQSQWVWVSQLKLKADKHVLTSLSTHQRSQIVFCLIRDNSNRWFSITEMYPHSIRRVTLRINLKDHNFLLLIPYPEWCNTIAWRLWHEYFYLKFECDRQDIVFPF